MKSKFLRELNFKTLLDYPDEFRPQREYKPPLACDRFCIECEKSGVVATGQLTLMSHGCDTDDFEKILGSSMNNGDAVKIPIMFLLEDPGGNYGNGEDRTHRDQKITKSPPVKRYYWSPSVTTWPTSMDEVIEDGNLYGSYFAYLMQKHSLVSVYITNVVKCKRVDAEKRWLVEDTCVKSFLEKELKEFAPSITFCFGWRAFNVMQCRFPDRHAVRLWHPAARANRRRMFRENDEWIRDALCQQEPKN